MAYNHDLTVNRFQESLDKRFLSDNHHVISDPNDIIPYFEKLDPTKKKAFVLLFIRWYLDSSMRYLEDAPKAVPAIKEVMKYRNTLTEWKNLSFGDFLDLGDSLSKQVSQSEDNKAEEQKFYADGEAQVFVDDADVKIIIPKTKAASCYFGKGTRWCTAATEHNAFDEYNVRGDLYIIIFRKDGPHWKKGDKWQFHPAYCQLMDSQDKPVENIHSKLFAQRYFPDIVTKYIDIQGNLIQYIDNPTIDQQIIAVNATPSSIYHIPDPSEDLQMIMAKIPPTKRIAICKTDAKQKIIKMFEISNIKDPCEKAQLTAINIDPDAIECIKNPTEKVKALVRQMLDK